ncbi:MAG: ATP-dependent Clp protease adapter ClpS [Acidimicrobiales bacterium]|nr:ATP-dependent Clp protease adapter ClpS [Acidimicrobiales bacterium]
MSFVSTPVITPSEIVDSELDETIQTDQPWVVLVWNDPINTMDYVALVFQKLFGYSKAKAERLMLQVHNEGRAVVSSGPRDQAEIDVFRLHEHGLWATMQHDK